MIKAVLDEPPDQIPQAILNIPIHEAVKQFGELREGEDDLDVYVGATFLLDQNVAFSVRHYRGHPKSTSTIYLDSNIRDVTQITSTLEHILQELDISTQKVHWQRRDDPDL
jgi:hypothetical protein